MNNTKASTVESKGLRDIQPPVEFPTDPLGLWIGLTLGLILLAAGGTVYRRWRRRQGDATPELSARDQARRGLEDLAQNSSSADLTQFYEKLTRVIRIFLKELTGLAAGDKTTSELDDCLGQPGAGLAVEDARRILAILRRGDDVKFAKAGMSPEQQQDDLRVITEWVNRGGNKA